MLVSGIQCSAGSRQEISPRIYAYIFMCINSYAYIHTHLAKSKQVEYYLDPRFPNIRILHDVFTVTIPTIDYRRSIGIYIYINVCI